MAGAWCATSEALLERRGAAESRKVKEQEGWSTVSWNVATELHWTFLHFQELPWYFNNCGWFNGSSGRQQHCHSWVCATHITACSFVVRQLSFRHQGEPTPCLLVCQHVHMLPDLPFCVPRLQTCCVSSLQCSSLIAVNQGRCREKANWVHLQDLDKSLSDLLFVIQLRRSQRHWLPFSKRICSAQISVNSGRKKVLFPLFTRPLQWLIGCLQKVLSWSPKSTVQCLLVNVVFLIYFKTFPLHSGTDCTEQSSFKMLPLQLLCSCFLVLSSNSPCLLIGTIKRLRKQ